MLAYGGQYSCRISMASHVHFIMYIGDYANINTQNGRVVMMTTAIISVFLITVHWRRTVWTRIIEAAETWSIWAACYEAPCAFSRLASENAIKMVKYISRCFEIEWKAWETTLRMLPATDWGLVKGRERERDRNLWGVMFSIFSLFCLFLSVSLWFPCCGIALTISIEKSQEIFLFLLYSLQCKHFLKERGDQVRTVLGSSSVPCIGRSHNMLVASRKCSRPTYWSSNPSSTRCWSFWQFNSKVSFVQVNQLFTSLCFLVHHSSDQMDQT